MTTRPPSRFRAPVGWAGLLLFLAACAGMGMVTQSQAADWPHWRGPDRNGTSTETGWLAEWPANGPAIAWKAKAGLGFSSFAIANGRAYSMGHGDEKDTVFCWGADDGKEIWKHAYPAELGDKFFDGGTTGTPTVDGDRVYTLNRWGEVFCFAAADGKILWNKNVQKETGCPVPTWGFGGSPLVHDDLLLLNVGESGLALDKKSGAVRWQSAAKDSGYSTPLPYQSGADWLGIIGSGEAYIAVNLQSGKEAWRIRWVTEYGVNAADPIVSGDHVFLSTGYGKGAGFFQLGGAEPAAVWKSKVLRTQLNPGVLRDGFVYGVDGDTTDKAALKCVELATGKERWKEAGFGSGGLILVDGKLVAISGTGELIVAPASPDGFHSTARAQILGGKCWTAPVLANGRVYCRNSHGDIACVDLRKK